MTTTAKVLQVLRLFDERRKALRASDVVDLLGVSPATAYRYVADLEEAGLIEKASLSEYVLGPSIVEMDRLIRENDPLIAAASELMKGLSDRTGGTILLSRLHGRKVVCVHQVRGRSGPPHVSYERGRAMSLFRGATSKVILAHLGPAELKELVRANHAELAAARLPTSVEALARHLAAVRDQQVCTTEGEVDREARGWAAPLRQGRALLGSLSLVMWAKAPGINAQRIADQLLRVALRVEGRLESPR